jgi:cysteine-rich repeat protein
VGEGCDDENRVDGDGCQADCSLPSCGDGVLDASELCDDGNNVPGDGCSTGCMSDESCGNGVVDLTVGEECDDGNLIDADGCQSDCALPTCGDGIRDATEICDDGDRESGDGCRSDCLSDETCGNGLIDAAAGEECDDGNTLDHDGCSATCLWEESATCDDDRALWERPAFTVPPSNPLDSLAPPFTVEAWILKRSTTLFQGAIASRYQVPATGNHRFQMAQWDSGDISVQFFAAGDSFYSVNYIASAPVGVGWHHVAVSCTASACTVFFDGQPGSPASFSTGTIPAWSGNWSFGANPNLNEQLRVPLDEVRLSDSARYSSSFVPKRRFFADANTLGLWHLDETTGTLVPDEGGLNHHGVVASGAWGPSECGFCNDGVDQDSNGQTDCADPSCIYKSVCW